VILLNKTDLVTTEQLDKLTNKVRGMNAIAKIYPTQNSEIDIDLVLGMQAFDLKNALAIDPQFLDEDAHEHDASVSSVAIADRGIVNGDKLNRWLNQLVQVIGQDIFRMKGILNLDDEDRRFVFQGVHMTLDGRPGKPWHPNEIRTNEKDY
jgi:G3E family GTPase